MTKQNTAPVTIPETSLYDILFKDSAGWLDKPALIDGGSGAILTYRQLQRRIRATAAGLHTLGLRKGDVLALISPNCPEFAIIFYAAIRLGVIVSAINPLSSTREIHALIQDSGARCMCCDPARIVHVQEACQQTAVEMILCTHPHPDLPDLASIARDEDPPAVSIDPARDLLTLPYSSGTTGLPKGVMLTHRNVVANLVQLSAGDNVSSEDTLIGLLPFFHIYGFTVILNAGLHHGATIVTMPRFDMQHFLQIMQDYHVTRAYLVPPIILGLTKHPLVDDYDLSATRVIISGAAPLDPYTAEKCAQRIGCTVKQGYGLTESSPVTHISPDPPGLIKHNAIGPALPNTECIIVDPQTNAILPDGEKGELLVRGPQVMRGYWNNAAASAQTLTEDGWLHTGDAGYLDQDGYLVIVDRIKEMIKYKGYQVAPAELEALLVSHPAIDDAAVVPLADEEAGEIPVAHVVISSPLSAEEIKCYVADRVSPHKKVRQVVFTDKIPRSSSGKILRRLLITDIEKPPNYADTKNTRPTSK